MLTDEVRYRCLDCGYSEVSRRVLHRCPSCNGQLVIEGRRGNVERDVPNMWRYRDFLPPVDQPLTLGEGLTRVIKLAQGLYLKDESRNPSGTFVDRGVSVLMSAEDSDYIEAARVDDYSASLSLYAKRKGVRLKVCGGLERDVDLATLFFILDRGGEVALSDRCTASLPYTSPFNVEGFKTIIYEVREVGYEFDAVVAPFEYGMLSLALMKAREELGLGLEIFGASISSDEDVDTPYGRLRVIKVGDREVLEAVKTLARRYSIYPKPISATALSVADELKRYYDKVLVVLSGTGVRRIRVRSREDRRNCRRMVLEALRKGPATGYEVWRRIRGMGFDITLQAVYKSLKSLEAEGLVRRRDVLSGRRRISIFELDTNANHP